MKKYTLLLVSISVLSPLLTFAANDVTLTTSAILSVGGYTLNITGSSAVVDSITVNSSTFSVTLSSGSSIQITSPTHNQMTVSASIFTTSNSCLDNTSVLTLASSGQSGTVTVTPTATICSTPASTPTPTPSSSGGGGNGPVVGSLIQTHAQSTPSPVVIITPITSSSTSSSYLATLLDQVAALTQQLNQLKNSQTGSDITYTFTRSLSLNMKGEDVRNLQKFLNTHGFVISASGAGSVGNETTQFGGLTFKMLKVYQASVGLPATGFFGPLTREKIKVSK